MKFVNQTNIKHYILTNINQVKIFEYYGTKYGTGINSHDIYKSLSQNSFMVKNPYRSDDKASLSFIKKTIKGDDKIIATDFGNDFYSGDCFHFTGIGLGLNSNNPRHFVKICKHILDNVSNDNTIISYNTINTFIEKKDNVLIIPTFREFINRDYKYWLSMGITKDNLHRYVFAINSYDLIVDDIIRSRYYYSYNDPCYCYFLGNMNGIDKYKLYFPYRHNKYARFITNNTFSFDDLLYMKPKQNVIFIKSIKDRILLTQILNEFYNTNIQVIATSSENLRLSSTEINLVNQLYKHKYTLFDNDKTGYENMIYCKNEYSYIPLYLIHSIKQTYPEFIPKSVINDDFIIHKDIPKDLTDFSKKYNYDLTKELVKHLIESML